jgi:glycosyltransferase involved in cell wall biosynthesis
MVFRNKRDENLVDSKRISVIVSAYSAKQKDQVLDCIGSLQNQSLPADEVILVLDKNPPLVEFYKTVVPSFVDVIQSDGFGLSRARNAGVKYSKSEVVVFIDDDAVADKDWLRRIWENYSDPSVVGVGGFVKAFWKNGKLKWFPEELNWVVGCSYAGMSKRKEPIRNPIGCNMSFRRSAFDLAGYFKPGVGRLGKALLDGEEPEFSMRVLGAMPAAKIVNEPSAVVYHKVSANRMSLSYLLKRSFYQGFSKGMISASFTKKSQTLSMERSYLNYLLTVSIKSRVRRIYSLRNLSQLVVLLFSTSLVFLGFAIGKTRNIEDTP